MGNKKDNKPEYAKKIKREWLGLIFGGILITIGIILTIVSYNSTLSGVYYVYTGVIFLGLCFAVPSLYQIIHPNKKFADVSWSNLSYKLLCFIALLLIAIIFVFAIINGIKAME